MKIKVLWEQSLYMSSRGCKLKFIQIKKILFSVKHHLQLGFMTWTIVSRWILNGECFEKDEHILKIWVVEEQLCLGKTKRSLCWLDKYARLIFKCKNHQKEPLYFSRVWMKLGGFSVFTSIRMANSMEQQICAMSWVPPWSLGSK